MTECNLVGCDIEWETSQIFFDDLYKDIIMMNGVCKKCQSTGMGRFILEDYHDD
jgi:hypothetical protein